MAAVALLSNPSSTGNKSLLPRVRDFAAQSPEIFHYEVNDVSEIPAALRTIARIQPKVLVINGGDGTVQATLTEMIAGNVFGTAPPPVAVLPNGKTNLIALDLGAGADPLASLEQILALVEEGIDPHVTPRKLISLSDGLLDRPVLGMFLGGAGLADSILYCRNKIYPLGLPNWFSHVLTTIFFVLTSMFGARARWLPAPPEHMRISVHRAGALEGNFFLLMVTTLERVLMGVPGAHANDNCLGVMAIEQRRGAILKAAWNTIRGRLGAAPFKGLHLGRGQEIRIAGKRAQVILDGEHFRAPDGGELILKPTRPVSFLNLAA